MADVGRPTKYKEEYNEQARKLCLLGATDEELASFFEVNEDTIYEWKNTHQKFSDSIKSGKELADATVAESLFKRATGYEHNDIDIKMYEGEIIQTPIVKHYPPDTGAMVFWLKNRQRKNWKDRQDTDITSNGENINIPVIQWVSSNENQQEI